MVKYTEPIAEPTKTEALSSLARYTVSCRVELDVDSQKMPRIIHGIEIRMECLVYTSFHGKPVRLPRMIHGDDLRRT